MDTKEPDYIPPKVTHRACPNCGYLISQLEVELSVIDYWCPKCECKKQSEFEPRYYEEH